MQPHRPRRRTLHIAGVAAPRAHGRRGRGSRSGRSSRSDADCPHALALRGGAPDRLQVRRGRQHHGAEERHALSSRPRRGHRSEAHPKPRRPPARPERHMGRVLGTRVARRLRPRLGGSADAKPVGPGVTPARRLRRLLVLVGGPLASSKWARVSLTYTVTASSVATINGQPYILIDNGTWAGNWLPGSTTSPRRLACSVPAKLSTSTRTTYSRISGVTGRIALTFDMGGRMDPALSHRRST